MSGWHLYDIRCSIYSVSFLFPLFTSNIYFNTADKANLELLRMLCIDRYAVFSSYVENNGQDLLNCMSTTHTWFISNIMVLTMTGMAISLKCGLKPLTYGLHYTSPYKIASIKGVTSHRWLLWWIMENIILSYSCIAVVQNSSNPWQSLNIWHTYSWQNRCRYSNFIKKDDIMFVINDFCIH